MNAAEIAGKGVSGSKCLFADQKSAFEQWLGSKIVPLGQIEQSQAFETARGLRVGCAELIVVEGDKSSGQHRCLCVFFLPSGALDKDLQIRCERKMHRTRLLFLQVQGAPIQRFCPAVLSQTFVLGRLGLQIAHGNGDCICRQRSLRFL